MSKHNSSTQEGALFEQACPVCEAAISLDPAMRGQKVQCPKCLNDFTCEKSIPEIVIADSPLTHNPSRRLSAADKNLRGQVHQLKEETGRLTARIADMQKEHTRTLAENEELRRKLESAQNALAEFSASVVTLIEFQERIQGLMREDKDPSHERKAAAPELPNPRPVEPPKETRPAQPRQYLR